MSHGSSRLTKKITINKLTRNTWPSLLLSAKVFMQLSAAGCQHTTEQHGALDDCAWVLWPDRLPCNHLRDGADECFDCMLLNAKVFMQLSAAGCQHTCSAAGCSFCFVCGVCRLHVGYLSERLKRIRTRSYTNLNDTEANAADRSENARPLRTDKASADWFMTCLEAPHCSHPNHDVGLWSYWVAAMLIFILLRLGGTPFIIYPASKYHGLQLVYNIVINTQCRPRWHRGQCCTWAHSSP